MGGVVVQLINEVPKSAVLMARKRYEVACQAAGPQMLNELCRQCRFPNTVRAFKDE